MLVRQAGPTITDCRFIANVLTCQIAFKRVNEPSADPFPMMIRVHGHAVDFRRLRKVLSECQKSDDTVTFLRQPGRHRVRILHVSNQ